MKQMTMTCAFVLCMVIGMCVRWGAEKQVPTLSIPAPNGMPNVRQGDEANGNQCLGEIPNKAKDLEEVLQYLHATTVRTFDNSPGFGGNRGGFGGAQFGSSQSVPKPESETKPRTHGHTPIPNGVSKDRRWRLNEKMVGKLTRADQWLWLRQLDGITHRGFVYKDRIVKDPPDIKLPARDVDEDFLRNRISDSESTNLEDGDRVWEVINLQLVGLLMHEKPVVYDKHLLIGDTEESESTATREPDSFESESLKDLRAGAERVVAWNEDEGCLQVLGAIRAKEGCLKCHNVKQGTLLGAFSYWIAEGIR